MEPALDFLLTDQVGTLRAVADTSGNIVKRIDYDSFGNIIADSNPSFSVPFGFAGGLHDRDTGLVRFGYRDYSPELGRFTAKDPIDFAGGDTNLYAYVMNDPVNFTDPLGLLMGFDAGEEYGEDATDYYARITLDPCSSGMAKAGAWVGGLFSSLWTRDTSDKTFWTLVGAYGLRNAGTPWQLADGSPARTPIDYGNLLRVEKHMIGRGATRGPKWHIDGLWGKIRHWPHGF